MLRIRTHEMGARELERRPYFGASASAQADVVPSFE
jgi:hypothetical protein